MKREAKMKIQINQTTKRYELLNNGKLEKSYVSRKDLQNHIDQNGIVITEEVSYDVVTCDVPAFSINQRFEFVSQLSEMVINGKVNSFLLLGAGGLGKSYSIGQKLEEHNMTEGQDYVIIKGALTPKGMFEVLKENSSKLIILDDTDDSLKDPKTVNMLKAALDTNKRRVISWVTYEGVDEIEFLGTVIFISNLPKDKLPQPLLSRSLMVDLHMTLEETIERLKFILPHMDTELSMEQRIECLDLLDEYKHLSRDVNARTLLKLFAIRNTGSAWKQLAIYSLVN